MVVVVMIFMIPLSCVMKDGGWWLWWWYMVLSCVMGGWLIVVVVMICDTTVGVAVGVVGVGCWCCWW